MSAHKNSSEAKRHAGNSEPIHFNENARVLVADDQPVILETVSEMLRMDGYQVTLFDACNPDWAVLALPYDVVLLDMVMPGTDGFALRREIIKHSPYAQFIIMTAHADQEKLDMAMDLGVFTFITKPFSHDHIRYAVLGALRLGQMLQKRLEQDVLLETENLGLIGRSPAMVDVRRKIVEYAPVELPVLLTGESGTGKEVVSRCIHHCSQRAARQFTAINCAGLSSTLIESELFGHIQGAFTGATKTKHGFFEVSDGGTVFLDEIGDLPLELQSRLLRILDRGEFSRVGEAVTRHVDVRVISATNRDLWEMVREKTFRADLYYRLRGCQIQLPPLRERRDDIPALVRYFLDDGRTAVAPEAMSLLSGLDWPGNIRELRMAITNLKTAVQGKVITGESVRRLMGITGQQSTAAATDGLLTYKEFKERVLKDTEREYFSSLIQKTGGNIARAAEAAGMYRKNFYDKLRQLGIEH